MPANGSGSGVIASWPYHRAVLLLVDLDGVVYRGSTPVPGVADVLHRRAAAGDTVVYVTNNSRWHREEYLARLQEVGVPVTAERIVSAARATAVVLAQSERRPAVAMVLGGPGLGREIRDAGIRTVAPTERGLAAEPDAIAVGVDFSLTYERLSIAAEVVRRGAWFVATNVDRNYPTSVRLAAGAGAIVAAVEVAGGRGPDVIVGKPEPRLFRTAAEIEGVDPRDAVVIGDGLLTDIAAAHAVGARSVLMLTGVTTAEQLAAATEDRPTEVAADAEELGRILERLAEA
jgi:HAD superfamily hydrolase (TIGR01450 family)